MKSPQANDVVTDQRFQRAVEQIVASCGESVRHLLTGHPLLPPKVIMQLSRTSPERQRFEIEQVRAGHRPFSVKTTVFDTTGYHEVISRLARAGGLLNKVRQQVAIITAEGEFPVGDASGIRIAATAVLRSCHELRAIIRSALPGDCTGSSDTNERILVSQRSWESTERIMPKDLVGDLNRAQAFIAKCARDLPRAKHLPTRHESHSCLVRLFQIAQDALRLLASLGGFPGQQQQTPVIATHQKPDVDALVATWLVQRFLVPGSSQVVFLPYGHDWTRGPVVDVVLDMWGLYQPSLWLFDHRPPAFPDRNATCAARLVHEHLLIQGQPVEQLSDLVELVHDGDSIRRRRGSFAYRESSRDGLHGIIRQRKLAGLSDKELYAAVCAWLDRQYLRSRGRRQCRGVSKVARRACKLMPNR